MKLLATGIIKRDNLTFHSGISDYSSGTKCVEEEEEESEEGGKKREKCGDTKNIVITEIINPRAPRTGLQESLPK